VLEFDSLKVSLFENSRQSVMDETSVKTPDVIEGQLNAGERGFITNAILSAPKKPQVALEVGTWLGGGSTLHILRALEQNGSGHLYGIEADSCIYKRMIENIKKGAPEAANRFTPIFGYSNAAIPALFAKQPSDFKVDFVFLDGGNNPMEQITEFRLLDKHIPVGGQLLMHDARKRKGKFLVPHLKLLDNWETQLHDFSEMGLFYARKIKPSPSSGALKAAGQSLRKLRLEPKEAVSALLPSWICVIILKLLPRRMARSLGEEK
jgi:predicted O-methyltransferase YrrM